MSFSEIILGEACEVGSSKRIYANEYTNSGIPFYRSKEVIQKARNESITEYLYISEDKFDELDSKFGSPKYGDILLASIGANLGVSYFVNTNQKFYFKDGNVTWFRNFSNELNSNFLYYWLNSVEGQHLLLNSAIGSAQKALTIDGLKKISLKVPAVEEQKAIADTLSCLDDMIKLNDRTNQILEEMAQAVFKQWFEDFEFPDEDGQPYKSSGGEMVDSELGQLPKGWRVFELSEIFEINPIRKITRGTIAPYLEMANMPTQGPAPRIWANREFESGMKFINGDTLVARITPCLENGKTAYVDFLEEDQVGWGSTEYIVLRPKPPITTVLAYILARSDRFRDYAIKRMIGSSGRQRVPADNIALYQIAMPPLNHTIHENFGIIVESMFCHMKSVAQESRVLSQSRDTLLPKLMSGEIRVPYEEEVI